VYKLYVVKILALFVVLLAGDALAQQKLFAVSGQGRGSQADARQAGQISQLESENQDRKTETTQNAADISDHETRISDNESELATIEPHAKESQASCAAGDLIHWDGSTYTCVNESDPTVGEHALTTTVPPDCHDVNAKLLWNANTKQWHCELDNNDGSGGGWTGSEDDPQVGTLYNGRLCRSDGSQVICDNLAPQISGNDIVVGGNIQAGGDIVAQGATFTDPIAAGEPTASNHLATKDYVDSVASGGGGGGSMPTCKADMSNIQIGDTCDDGSKFLGSHPNFWWKGFYVTDETQGTSNNWNGANSLCSTLDRHGHTDWYLPSKSELGLIEENDSAIGDVVAGSYWSSTEYNASAAWFLTAVSGEPNWSSKAQGRGVRCVRKD